jgi:hypothetical protein
MLNNMQETQGSTVSKRGFAELIGVTPGRVSQMLKDGLPVEPNGRIVVDAGRAWVTANVDPNRRRLHLDGDGPVRSSKAKKETAEAEIAHLRAAQLGGELIERAATLQAIEGRSRFEQEAWIGWVNRASPEIAAAVNADLAAVVAVLDRLVREQLATLATTPLDLGIAE